MNDSVVAVVVTFNRKVLLLECLNALFMQTVPLAKIIIVDNFSSDGTERHLKENGYLDNPVIDYRRLDENTGGAGGFNRGIQIALNYSAEWFLLMDDDGRSDHECLEMLLENSKGYDVLGPLIISTEDESKTSNPYITNGSPIFSVEMVQNYPTVSPVHPFNGTLISRRIVEKIGLPDKRFFIWGDEIDYRGRWMEAGFKEATVTSAKYFHPPAKVQFEKTSKRSIPIIKLNDSKRKYIYYRNYMYNYKYINKSLFKKTAKMLFTAINVAWYDKSRATSIRGLIDGFISNFNNLR